MLQTWCGEVLQEVDKPWHWLAGFLDSAEGAEIVPVAVNDPFPDPVAAF
jgi:hypothetical protein